MKVTSPVGDFPFTVERIRVEDGRLVVHGRMGAWPSRVELAAADLPALARAAPLPLVGIGVGAAAFLILRRVSAAR
jgi:hypothetical protein